MNSLTENDFCPKSVIETEFSDRNITTEVEISRGTKFGPFPGRDSVQRKFSEWMKYVTCVTNLEESNLLMFLHERQLYFYAFRSILPGMELIVWAGKQKMHQMNPNEWVSNENVMNFICQVCCTNFSTHYGLHTHWMCVHRPAGSRSSKTQCKCPHCPQIIASRKNLRKHVLRHFRARLNNNNNNSNNNSNNNNNNNKADKTDDTKGNKLNRWPKKMKNFVRNEQVKQQQEKVIQKALIKAKMDTKKTFRCSRCSERFECLKDVFKHRREIHADLLNTCNDQLMCNVCRKVFKSKTTRNRHFKTVHAEVKPFECSVCHIRYSRSDNIKDHILCKHNGNATIINVRSSESAVSI